MKNSNDTIGKRTRDLPACSAVPQTTALPRASHIYCVYYTPAWNQAFNVMMVIMWTGPSVYCLILKLGSLPRLNCVFAPILKLLTACKLLAVLWRVQTTKPSTFFFRYLRVTFCSHPQESHYWPNQLTAVVRSNRIGQRPHSISIVMYTLAPTSYLTPTSWYSTACEQGTLNDWQTSKAFSIPLSVWFHNKIIQTANSSHVKPENWNVGTER